MSPFGKRPGRTQRHHRAACDHYPSHGRARASHRLTAFWSSGIVPHCHTPSVSAAEGGSVLERIPCVRSTIDTG